MESATNQRSADSIQTINRFASPLEVATELHPSFFATAAAALHGYRSAKASKTRSELEHVDGVGADGTATMHIDGLIEAGVIDAAVSAGVNVLSEEAGFVDVGSSLTLVIDPLDGSANAAAGVPISGFGAALVDDGRFVEALIVWLETGWTWAGSVNGGAGGMQWCTTQRTELAGAAVSMLRPHPHTWEPWTSVVRKAARVRILSCSMVESALVLQGSTDVFLDALSDTHRLVDLAPACVLLPLAGGAVIDAKGRPISFDVDLTKRWSGIVAASAQIADDIVSTLNNS